MRKSWKNLYNAVKELSQIDPHGFRLFMNGYLFGMEVSQNGTG
jgi:hypothetical protein